MTYLRQFPNLLLDEDFDYDFYAIEKKRILREDRLVKAKRLKEQEIAQLETSTWHTLNSLPSIARKIFLHDEIGHAVPIYDTDGNSFVITNNLFNVEHVVDKQLFVPLLNFNTRARDINNAVKWLASKEDQALFRLLQKTEQNITNVGELTLASVNAAFRQIEQHDCVVCAIIVGDWGMSTIDGWGSDFYDRVQYNLRFNQLLKGHLYTADIYHSRHPALFNKAYFLAAPDSVGVYASRGNSLYGPSIRTEWGMALVNPKCVSWIEMV